jgi:hypothetical protein
MQRKEHRQDCPPRRAGRTTAKDQGNGRVKGAHLKVAATESTAEAIEATGRRCYERQRRTGRIGLLRRAGPPAAGRPVPPSQRRLRRRCGRPSEMGSSPSIPRSGTGSQDELLPRCGSNSQAAPVPTLSVRRERWCGIDQFVSAFVRRRDKRTVSLYFAYYF